MVAAPVRRSVLRDIDGRAAVFPAQGKPLQHAQQHEQDGRCDADACESGQKADACGSPTHQHNGDDERVFAA